MIFTDSYAEQSCTAGRASFITGQCGLRTGLTKVGLPGAELGLKAEDITIAEALKPLGYRTGQFGKNHLGDRDEHLPTKNPRTSTIRTPKTSPTSRRSTDRAACCTAGPTAKVARRSRTPAR